MIRALWIRPLFFFLLLLAHLHIHIHFTQYWRKMLQAWNMPTDKSNRIRATEWENRGRRMNSICFPIAMRRSERQAGKPHNARWWPNAGEDKNWKVLLFPPTMPHCRPYHLNIAETSNCRGAWSTDQWRRTGPYCGSTPWHLHYTSSIGKHSKLNHADTLSNSPPRSKNIIQLPATNCLSGTPNQCLYHCSGQWQSKWMAEVLIELILYSAVNASL